jgi:hypothetical protein
MSTGTHIRRTYIASTHTLAAYPERGEVSGMDRTRVRVAPSEGRARAGAIDAGTPTVIEPRRQRGLLVVETQRREDPRADASVIGSTHRPAHRERANACEHARRTRTGTMTSCTRVNGGSMTSQLPDNEKARRANTGLSQEASLVVTVGIRSDRRQTA